jgi:hypothetical protein
MDPRTGKQMDDPIERYGSCHLPPRENAILASEMKPENGVAPGQRLRRIRDEHPVACLPSSLLRVLFVSTRSASGGMPVVGIPTPSHLIASRRHSNRRFGAFGRSVVVVVRRRGPAQYARRVIGDFWIKCQVPSDGVLQIKRCFCG